RRGDPAARHQAIPAADGHRPAGDGRRVPPTRTPRPPWRVGRAAPVGVRTGPAVRRGLPRPGPVPATRVGGAAGGSRYAARVTARLPLRARLACLLSRLAAAASRATGRGDGSVIGGRIGLLVDPRLLERLSAGRRVALVSGTNGKTTTTRLTAAAVGVLGPVATNPFGANMPTGHVSALVREREARLAVLEVDEHWLPKVIGPTGAEVV